MNTRFEYKGYRVIIVLTPKEEYEKMSEEEWQQSGVAIAHCYSRDKLGIKFIFYNECDYESEIKKRIDNLFKEE